MRETNRHLHARNGRRTFDASFALWVMVLALALSPLASCKNAGDPGDPGNSAEPEELLKLDSNTGYYFSCAGIDENWIYYVTDNRKGEGFEYTFWRASKDGTGKSALGTMESWLYHDYELTPANGRLYYIPESRNGICSSPIDFSETAVLTENADSFYKDLKVIGEWIYFIREDPSVIPKGMPPTDETLCRMKLDGSDMSEIAALDGVTSYSNLYVVVGSRLYHAFYAGESNFAIAVRDMQEGEETTISRGYNSIGSILYSNGSLFYSATSPDTHTYYENIFSLDTEAPYTEKTLVTGADHDNFDIYLVENGWVYYQKRVTTGIEPCELWRIRTDGTGAECLVDDGNYAHYLAIEGGYIYYETMSEGDSADPSYLTFRIYQMKTP